MIDNRKIEMPLKSRAHLQPLKNERGVTLLETTMVLVIMSVLSYSAIVHFSASSSDVQARAAAAQLMHDLRFAQQWAIANSRSVTVAFEAQNNRYSLKWQDTGAYLLRPAGGGNYVVRFGEGNFPDVEVSTTLGGSALTFDASGRPCNGQQLLLTTADVAVLTGGLIVRVTPNTGKLQLIE
jgi:prepilin-type N-terminal cleavage/methylation domain-containing protein